MYSKGGNLLLRHRSSGQGPDSGAAGCALGKHAVIRAGTNEHLFQLAQVLDNAQRWEKATQIENGITHQLPRPVIGDVPATVGFKQLDAATGQQLTIRYPVLQ